MLHLKLSRDSMVSIPVNSSTGERIAMMQGNGGGVVRNGYIELNPLRTYTDAQEVRLTVNERLFNC